MVRIYVESEGIELPMDFEPDEALEIAEELRAAAEKAMAAVRGRKSAATEREPRRGGRDARGNPRGRHG
jgi:hypothetical protein